MSFATLKPKKRASHSTTLLVVLNYNLYAGDIISWVVEINTIQAPKPSLEEAPSKKIFQTEVIRGEYS
jgi:hypothetical protein